MEINKFYIDGKFVEPDGSDKIDIVNPATAASPPLPPETVVPSTSHWKPPISKSVLYHTSSVSK